MKLETNDGLSSCSNFPESPTAIELAENKSVLLEIEKPTCEVSEKKMDSLRYALNRNADVFSKHKTDMICCNFMEH